jgi:thiamine transport system substrate-binding protein
MEALMRKLLVVMIIIVLAGCSGPVGAKPAQPTLTVMAHDSFAVSEAVVAAFEAQTGARVVFLKGGDAGEMINRAVLTRQAPQADVLYGVDNTFLSRALDANIFEAYASPVLTNIPAEFQLDDSHRALPVDFGDVCLNYDKAWFESHAVPLPQSLSDLSKPEYKGLLVVENPATSSPGLAFLLATIAEFGDPGYLDYWKALRANQVAVVNDWSSAYYVNFSGSQGKGAQPLVVSYASSPAAEVVYAVEPLTDAPTASITAAGMCFRQVEFVGILKGTLQRQLAEQWIDFMLGTTFQEDMPLQMFVYPVNSEAVLPDVFAQYATIAENPSMMSPEEIRANREEWIAAWTEVVLR